MSDTTPETEETTVVDQPTDTPDSDTGPGDTAEAPEGANPSREAARWRTQFREAEAALAAAQARIDTLHRLDIERLAGATLSHPTDLFSLSGNEPADYVDPDTGLVDAEKVAADCAAILLERPGMRKPDPASDRSQGLSAPVKSEPTWEAMFSD